MKNEDHRDMAEALAELDRRRAFAAAQGGEQRVARQHARGRLTARERVALVADEGSFVEYGQLALSAVKKDAGKTPADGIVTGVAQVDGRKCAVVAFDATVLAGTMGEVAGHKQGLIAYLASDKGYPTVMLGDSGGARLPDLLTSNFMGEGGGIEGENLFGIRAETVRIPRVAACLGNTTGDPALWAAFADFAVMPSSCTVGLTGPSLVGAAIGEKVEQELLGGPALTAKKTGIVSKVVETEQECFTAIKQFLSYLPSNANLPAPLAEPRPPKLDPEKLYEIVPENFRMAYNMRRVLDAIVDEDSFFELHELFGPCLLAGLARIEGQPVGILANQPNVKAGTLDASALRKAKKLVDLCNGFGLPIVFLQDLPGTMIGSDAEKEGIAVWQMELYKSLAKVKVPRVSVIVRKASGFGWLSMGGGALGTDYICAWPNAKLMFMDAHNAAQLLYRKEIDAVREESGSQAVREFIEKKAAEIEDDSAPWGAAEKGYIHDVIKPDETRDAIARGLFVATGYK